MTHSTYRRVLGICSAPLERLLTLRTVDDVFLFVTSLDTLDARRSALLRFQALGQDTAFAEVAGICGLMRRLGTPPTFSVTASFAGGRNYTSSEIKNVVASSLVGTQRWHYGADDHEADLSVRVFIERDQAMIGVRLAPAPLHRRAYQHARLLGTLKAPVAAAMLHLADCHPGASLLDPCCGSGTIVIEAALQANALAAGVSARFTLADARRLPVEAGSIEHIVTNLPWGRQVRVAEEDDLAALYAEILAELRRILTPTGRVVLLVREPALLVAERANVRYREWREISLAGQTPMVVTLAGFR